MFVPFFLFFFCFYSALFPVSGNMKVVSDHEMQRKASHNEGMHLD